MIHHRFRMLFPDLGRVLRKAPANLVRGSGACPRSAPCRPPWETRAVVALLEYRRAVLNIWELVLEHSLRNAGPHLPAEGSIPGAPDLHYTIDECACYLIDQTTGAHYQVHNWQSEPYLFWKGFAKFVTGHNQQPGCPAPILSFRQVVPSLGYALVDDYPWTLPEEVWERDAPDGGMIQITARDLEDAGVAVEICVLPYGRQGFQVADEVLAVEEALGSVYSGTDDPRDRLWRMACVGDWLGVDVAALELGGASLVRLTQERDAQCREERLGRIHARIGRDGGLTPRTLVTLEDLGPEHSTAHIARALSPGHRAARTAMKIVARRDDPAWFETVRKLRLRLGCLPGSLMDADLVKACNAFLAKCPKRSSTPTGASPEVVQPLTRVGRAIELS